MNLPAPPVAARVAARFDLHGDLRIDPYYWLRDGTDPEVIRYLEAENRYTAAAMRPAEALQEKIFQEIVGRIKETDLTVPARVGDYFYYIKTEQGKQYPIWCRKEGSTDGPEELLLDGNVLGRGEKYFRVGVFEMSPNQNLLAYSIDTAGDESYTLFVKDLETGELLEDRVPNTYYSVHWANDNRTLFYNVIDPLTKRPYKLFRHKLGAAPESDVVVYHETDEAFALNLTKTKSRQYLFIELESAITTEMRYLRAGEPDGEFRVMERRRHDVEYDAVHQGDYFYIRVSDSGRNFRLVRAPVESPSSENWEEVVPHRAEVLLEAAEAFHDHLVLVEREDGLRRLRIRRFDALDTIHEVGFAEPAFAVSLNSNPEFDTWILRYTYTSLVTPSRVFDYDMETGERLLLKQTEVLGGYDPGQYESERVFAQAPGGVRIPISLVYRKGTEMDERNPLLLYGYGSYGASIDAAFAPDRLSLLDRGFVYAIAHVRGGAEMGRHWHDEGKMLCKKNTFADFIACAEHLIQERYTSADRLAIMGGSAGGLLVGAALNMRPELFHAAVAKVPFVDVLNTMLDTSLPLTVGEFDEWGNPQEEKFYTYIKSYSPYDNVNGHQRYPHLLVTAGLNDPRVSYWEPAKWVAKLRSVKRDSNLLLLKTNMGAGHFGASGRYEQWKERAFDWAFLLTAFGISE